ncbi:MAG: right-handed parallel beta-helix repeat-containing protein [Candidatus Bathyarchaeota archaeon]|nr:MAG: right-handed parallel beta-helix repeat-containing protein [Candidatus Bathyarchaeota archaeon]
MKQTAPKLISILLLFLLCWTLCVNVSFASYWPDPGPDLPRIYIQSNGNVQPETSLLEKTGNVYKLTGDIVHYTIEIQCDNIVLDGAGYTIYGDAERIKGYDDGNNGIIVDGQKNLTIKNINFEHGDTGIRVSNSSNLTIVGNSFSNKISTGINLQTSTQSLLENNTFTAAVLISGSKITFQNNTISGPEDSVSSSGIKIMGSLNTITNNTLACILPMELQDANLNTVSLNTITGPPTSDGRDTLEGGEGIALFRNCYNNIFFGNNITGFYAQAIRTVFSNSNNTFYGNYISDTPVAVTLQDGAVNNTFYGNFFASDSCTVRIDEGVEGISWDNGTIGNYWGDYTGTDNNQDGIGDSPYFITAVTWDNDVGGDVTFVGGQDNHPIINPIDINDISQFPSWTPVLIMLVAFLIVAVIYKQKLHSTHSRV